MNTPEKLLLGAILLFSSLFSNLFFPPYSYCLSLVLVVRVCISREDLRIILIASHILTQGIPSRVKQEEQLKGVDEGERGALVLVCSVRNRSGHPWRWGLESALGVDDRSLWGSQGRKKAGCVWEVEPGYW